MFLTFMVFSFWKFGFLKLDFLGIFWFGFRSISFKIEKKMYDASNVITEISRISYCCIIGLYIDYVDWYKREITIVIPFIDHNYSIVTLIASKKISV